MKILIHVTQAHIDKGVPDDMDACPVVLATTEALGVPTRLIAGQIQYRSGVKIADMPASVKQSITRYDKLKGMQPFNFYLIVPVEP